MKDPFSLASYPLLLAELRPATILEIGSFLGGSAIWMADMMAVQGVDGRVYSFDVITDRINVTHPRVGFKWADATNRPHLTRHGWPACPTCGLAF